VAHPYCTLKINAGFVRHKKAEEDATSCSIKDGAFFAFFSCLMNPARVSQIWQYAIKLGYPFLFDLLPTYAHLSAPVSSPFVASHEF
jgi:hypothetical protein